MEELYSTCIELFGEPFDKGCFRVGLTLFCEISSIEPFCSIYADANNSEETPSFVGWIDNKDGLILLKSLADSMAATMPFNDPFDHLFYSD